jgi:hypothetical protein
MLPAAAPKPCAAIMAVGGKLRAVAVVSWSSLSRGRDGDCSPPPAQIPACGTTAPGSHLGFCRRSARREADVGGEQVVSSERSTASSFASSAGAYVGERVMLRRHRLQCGSVDLGEQLVPADAELAHDWRHPSDVRFKVLILQASHSLSDERTEFLIKDRLSFMLASQGGLTPLGGARSPRL